MDYPTLELLLVSVSSLASSDAQNSPACSCIRPKELWSLLAAVMQLPWIYQNSSWQGIAEFISTCIS